MMRARGVVRDEAAATHRVIIDGKFTSDKGRQPGVDARSDKFRDGRRARHRKEDHRVRTCVCDELRQLRRHRGNVEPGLLVIVDHRQGRDVADAPDRFEQTEMEDARETQLIADDAFDIGRRFDNTERIIEVFDIQSGE